MPREDFETSLLADYLRVLTKKSGPLQTSKTVRRSTARTSRSWVDPRGLLTAALKSCLEGQTLPCPLKSNKNEKYWEFLGVEEVEGFFFLFLTQGSFGIPGALMLRYLTIISRISTESTSTANLCTRKGSHDVVDVRGGHCSRSPPGLLPSRALS